MSCQLRLSCVVGSSRMRCRRRWWWCAALHLGLDAVPVVAWQHFRGLVSARPRSGEWRPRLSPLLPTRRLAPAPVSMAWGSGRPQQQQQQQESSSGRFGSAGGGVEVMKFHGGGGELRVDRSRRVGSGSYGVVYPGLLGEQQVVVKGALQPGGDHNEAQVELSQHYLEVEEHCNAKLHRRDPATAAKCFAPFLGHATDAAGRRYLVWKRTGSGTTLRDLLEQGTLIETLVSLGLGTDRPSALHTLLASLATMVKACHVCGIVHRDVKPANVVVDEDGRTLRLVDFGSAADMKSLLRRGYDYSRSPCSPFYCAPEQFIDESHPWAFDVYSLGVVWLRCAFPHLHAEPAWEEFYAEFKSAEHDLDLWLQRELSDDAMPAALLEGLEFFNDNGGRGWRMLQQMLRANPRERLGLDLLLSDPYLALPGGGGIVSQRSETSRSFFDAIMQESVDVCAVEEQALSVRVSLARPMGLGLEQAGEEQENTHTQDEDRPTIVSELVPGGHADRCEMVEVGDTLLMVGDIDCTTRSFDDIMTIISTFPGDIVPLVFERGAAHPRPQPDMPRGLTAMRISDCGVVSIQGKRAGMEDAFCTSRLTITPFGEEDSTPTRAYLAAVFDGHRGSFASQFAAAKLPQLVRRTLSRRHRMGDAAALRTAWSTLEQEYLETGSQSGSTVAAALVVNGMLHVLNCGDSRVVLTARGHVADATSATGTMQAAAVAFSTLDHSASNAAEMARIERLGGEVLCTTGGRPHVQVKAQVRVPVLGGNPCSRDQWLLGVARCLGGTEWRAAGVVPVPDMTSVRLADVHDAVVVATDGLWEVMDVDTCAALVGQWRARGKTASEAAQLLCTTAAQQGSADNISAIVIYLCNTGGVGSGTDALPQALQSARVPAETPETA